MSTQYETIQAPYDLIRQKTIAFIERENVQSTLAPYIQNARVLELACGSGFYTSSFLKWGARSVLAVDISPVMIAQAQRLYDADAAKSGSKQEEGEAGVRFLLADCAVPEEYPGGPFDVVFGAWLLNYAKDKAGLVNMFRNGALNLKSGGVFVSVTYPASEDPTASLNEERRARPPPEGSGGLVFSKIGDVEGGIFMGAHGETEVGDVDFRCWWLRGGVYEGAAREAGLEGELRWGRTRVPERWLRGEERWEGGASRTELETYVDVPRFGVLVVGR